MAVARPCAVQIGGIEAIAVRIERLPEARELDAEFGRRLPQQRRASAALFIIILVLDPGIVDAVDPARRLAPGEAARNRERVGRDRRIDIDLPAPAEAARVLDGETFGARAHLEFARVDRKSTRLNSSH